MQSLIFAAWMWAGSVAQADDYVVHGDEGATVALTRVAGATGQDPSGFRVATLRELVRGRAPVLLGEGYLTPCGGAPSTMSTLRLAVERAEGSVSYMEFDKAAAHLRTARVSLGCLRDPVEPEVATRLHFLDGIAAHAAGDSAAASRAFARAFVYEPGLNWDGYFAPKAKPLFDEAKVAAQEQAKGQLVLIPEPGVGTLWVDGQSVDPSLDAIEVVPGDHLVQVLAAEVVTVSVNVEAGGNVQLVIPRALPSEAVAWVDEEARRSDLQHVFDAVLVPGSTIHMAAGDRVYRTVIGSVEPWDELEVPTRYLRGGNLSPRQVTARSLIYGGGSIGLIGASLAASGYFAATAAYHDGTNASSWDGYLEANANYAPATERLAMGRWLGLGGLALAGTGFYLHGEF